MSNLYSSQSQPQPGGPGLRWRCAYHLLMPNLRAIPRQRLIEVEMDIPTVGRATLARIHRILATRAEIAANIPDFDLAILDRLELVVRAMCYVHWICQSSYAAQELLAEWLRDIALFGFTRQRHSHGQYLNLLDSHEGRLCPYQGRCLLNSASTSNMCVLDWWWQGDSEAELRYCQIAQFELLNELGAVLRENGNDLDDAQRYFNLERQRAFTYFLTTYDHVRRAVQFVRWRAGDADDIVPSLEPALTRRRRISQVVPTLRLQTHVHLQTDYDLLYGTSNVRPRSERTSS